MFANLMHVAVKRHAHVLPALQLAICSNHLQTERFWQQICSRIIVTNGADTVLQQPAALLSAANRHVYGKPAANAR
jgi:hypothetical protein